MTHIASQSSQSSSGSVSTADTRSHHAPANWLICNYPTKRVRPGPGQDRIMSGTWHTKPQTGERPNPREERANGSWDNYRGQEKEAQGERERRSNDVVKGCNHGWQGN